MISPLDRGPGMELSDYRQVLRVVEDSGSARTFTAFREAVLEALGRHLGYRHLTFFTGDHLPAIFEDPAPITTGRARRMERSYRENFHRLDPFALLCRHRPVAGPTPLSLDAFRPHARRHEEYLEQFLFRHGIHAKIVIPMSCATRAAGVGILAEDSGGLGLRDMARLTALAPHLTNLLTLHTLSAAPRDTPLAQLTPRQTAVAQLAAHGASNRQIAAALHVTVDTVKKHLTAAYRAAGCTNRAQLVLAWTNAATVADHRSGQ